MKTTIITSVITTVITSFVISHFAIILWIACGVSAVVITNKVHPHFNKAGSRLTQHNLLSWAFVAFGPISLALILVLLFDEIINCLPFKFQSPITKIKNDVAPE